MPAGVHGTGGGGAGRRETRLARESHWNWEDTVPVVCYLGLAATLHAEKPREGRTEGCVLVQDPCTAETGHPRAETHAVSAEDEHPRLQGTNVHQSRSKAGRSRRPAQHDM